MKLIKIYYIIIIIIIVNLTNCQNNEINKGYITENDKFFEVFYDSNNKTIVSRYELNEDSIRNGEAKEFYKSGSLKSLFFYNEGVIEGEKITFYENVYVKYYDTLGSDTIIIEHPAYKTYKFYGKNGSVKFIRKYDKKGNIISDEGSIFVLCRINSRNLKVGDNFYGQFYIIRPPNTISEIHVNIFYKGEKVKSKNVKINENYDAGFFEMPFNEPGDFEVEIIGMNKDTIQNIIKLDTIKYNLSISNDIKKI